MKSGSQSDTPIGAGDMADAPFPKRVNEEKLNIASNG